MIDGSDLAIARVEVVLRNRREQRGRVLGATQQLKEVRQTDVGARSQGRVLRADQPLAQALQRTRAVVVVEAVERRRLFEAGIGLGFDVVRGGERFGGLLVVRAAEALVEIVVVRAAQFERDSRRVERARFHRSERRLVVTSGFVVREDGSRLVAGLLAVACRRVTVAAGPRMIGEVLNAALVLRQRFQRPSDCAVEPCQLRSQKAVVDRFAREGVPEHEGTRRLFGHQLQRARAVQRRQDGALGNAQDRLEQRRSKTAPDDGSMREDTALLVGERP